MKKHDISKWPIPAFLFIGIGLGLLLFEEFPAAIPAFALIGFGVGLLVTFFVSRKK
ncbi:MAG: multidrug transporter [archaeon]